MGFARDGEKGSGFFGDAGAFEEPSGVAVTPDGSKVYVANGGRETVSVIATATNTVTATIGVGHPFGVAVTPDGSKVYVTNVFVQTVSVIDTATNMVAATIAVGADPFGVAVTPDGSKVYVANFASNNVSVIAAATNKVTATVAVGSEPGAFGVFIQPRFAGTPREGKLLRPECLDARPAVPRPQCRGCSLGVPERQRTAECRSGVLRRIAAWGRALGSR